MTKAFEKQIGGYLKNLLKVQLTEAELSELHEIFLNEFEIKSNSLDEGISIINENGTPVTFNRFDAGLISAIRETCDVKTKVEIVDLSASEMEVYIQKSRLSLASDIKKFLSKKHRYNETDEQIDFKSLLADDYIAMELYGIPSYKSIPKLLKDIISGKMTLLTAQNFFDTIKKEVKDDDTE